VDSRIEKKAEVKSFTPQQEMEVEALRAELTKVEALLRDANERELPEEVFRVQVETKREELNSLMEKFAKMNAGTGSPKKTTSPSSGTAKHYKKNDVRSNGPTTKDRRRAGGGAPTFASTPLMHGGIQRRNWNDTK
jgi:hypothetical protein